jgi:hypothetical protein
MLVSAPMRFRWLGVAGVFAAVTVASAARAGDGGAAQALFDKGVADLEAGRPETACPAFTESQRLDPRPGTLFALADCEAALGKIASALGHYHEYLGWVSRLADDDRARHAERVELARAQVEALQSKVPTLVLALSASAPAGTVIERDGVVLQGAALGVALPIDPGEHVVVTRTPGQPEERLTLSIAAGDAKRLELPFRPAPPPSTAPAPAPVVEPTARPPEPQAPPSDDGGDSQRTLGYVAGGVGLVGLVVGSVTGLLVLDRKATVDAECVNHACTKEGKQAADSGQSLAAVSTIAFGVGLAGLATGVTLVLTAPGDQKRSGAWLAVTQQF